MELLKSNPKLGLMPIGTLQGVLRKNCHPINCCVGSRILIQLTLEGSSGLMPTINKNAKEPMINARTGPLFIFEIKKKKQFFSSIKYGLDSNFFLRFK
jgi:hypothetical protein